MLSKKYNSRKISISFLPIATALFFLLGFIGKHSYAFTPTSLTRRRYLLSKSPHRLVHNDITKLSSSQVDIATTTQDTVVKKDPLVQREYMTYLWDYNAQKYNINYRVEGNGPPVLLVHGFGANVNHFRFQFPALVEQGYRVYAIDLLGFGASDKPKDEDYCIELWVDLLKDFVKTMSATEQKWVVCGNSIGGLCSLAVSEQMPHLVRGCVLFNCSGGMTGFRYEELPWLLRPVLYFLQKVVLGPRFGGQFFENFKTRENVESILRQQGVYGDVQNVNEELLEMLLGPSEDDGAKEVFLKVFAGPAGPTPESILPNIQCPILALWGEADPWTPVDGGMHPGNAFGDYTQADYQLVVLPGAGHCPHDECPDAIHETLLPWMAALDNNDDNRDEE